jgi:RNA 2',3'-cyclic 3'-phosphodiesterase
MPEQLAFPGLEPELQSSHTMFFAIKPDPDTGAQVANFREQLIETLGLKGKLIRAQLFHVTLLDLGLFAANKADIARRAAETVAIAPLDIVFDRVLSFAGSDVLVLAGSKDGNIPLAALRQNLEVAMRKLGLRANPIRTPHMSLMYGNRTVAEHPVKAIRWTVKEFVLVRSHVGHTLHEPLGAWPIRN